MKLLVKYYRWRLAHASELDKTKWKYKIYRATTYKRSLFGGLDLTFFPDPQAMKKELTAGVGEIEPDPVKRTLAYDKRDAGRYAVGAPKWVIDKGTGVVTDVTDWRTTPQEWAEDKEKNQAHMPTEHTRTSRGYTKSRDHEAWKKQMGYE